MNEEIYKRLLEIRNKIHKDVLDLCALWLSFRYTIEDAGYRITIEIK